EANKEIPGFRFSNWAATSFLLVFASMAVGLTAKPMLVTLPFVLLLCDLWPFGRLRTVRDLRPLLLEKMPLFVLAAGSCIVTFAAQRSAGAVETLEFLPFGTRLMNALTATAKYVVMAVYPADLGVWYPYNKNIPLWQVAASVVLLAVITALCVWSARTRPYFLMGWLWFLGTLVPVIGIIQVGSQSMADRYTYIPYFGLFIMAVWGVRDTFEFLQIDVRWLFAAFALIIVALTGLSIRQAAFWKNGETLYRHTLAVTKNNDLISQSLCYDLVFKERLDEAEGFCRSSIEIRPNNFEAHNTLGILQFKRGNLAEAEASFRQAISLSANDWSAYANLALVQTLQGRPEEGESNLQKAVTLYPGKTPAVFATTLNDLSVAYLGQKKYEKASENLKRLLYLQPGNSDARANLALTLFILGRYDEAQAEAGRAVSLDPNSAAAHNIAGVILLKKDQKANAIAEFERAIQLNEGFDEAKANLKKARGEK
ncbi:MAG TPA: tetratricopeptide repeat protein, partial [Pyrinomonadaceae bacterium]|nr:tetratricopeptide repeat protein [Pyrinomonadaceae bacterium]